MCRYLTKGQSFKHSTVVIYDYGICSSIRNFVVITTVESSNILITLATGNYHCILPCYKSITLYHSLTS